MRCSFVEIVSIAWRVVLAVMVACLCIGNAPAVEVTAMTEGNEYRFAFKGGAFPYVLRLWESPIGKDIYRGIGLRSPWYENPNAQNAWYQNSFMDISINGKPVIGGANANKKYPLLFERCEVLESGGERALAQYVWDREEALVRLRFLMRPESRALLAEIQIEPKQQIEKWFMDCSAYPGAYTSKNDGDRRMKTAIREEKSVTNVQVNIQTEPWMLLCDQKLDMADPINMRVGFVNNGCAGFYLLPDGVATNTVSLTGYPVDVGVLAQPSVTRLRFAFDELPMANSNALATMQKEAPKVLKLLKEETFQPVSLTAFDVERERKEIDGMSATGCSCRRHIPQVKDALKKADGAITGYKLNSGTKPISAEQEALNALNFYRRSYLTAVRRSDRKVRVFEMRGLGYGKYRTARVLDNAGKDGAEISGGYYYRSGQGSQINPFPGTIEQMYKYDVFLMLDIDTHALSSRTLHLLRQYIEDGGGLIVFGGFYSYGASNIRDTPLGSILPFVVRKAPFGLCKAPEKSTLAVSGTCAFLSAKQWGNNLVAPWFHELVPVEDASVVMSNGNMPWMAIRSAGKGRVIACAGTLMGSPSPGKTMYYEWEGWPDCLWRMIQWASGK
ncbi:MAG: hypothetical protein L6437_06995 [Kiritimatiellae bacterium]|nr:hypothetical protein [Kiritimatiellia bacterium]